MKALAWHVISRRQDDRVLAPSPELRRALARTVLRLGRDHGLLLFRGPDTHLHQVLRGERLDIGRYVRDLETALCLHLGLGAGWAPARFIPVESQRHLVNLRPYVLGQDLHHGVGVDHLAEASNLPDLLGARVNGAYTAGRLRELLPRTTRPDLLAHLGLDGLDPVFVPEHLLAATLSALALSSLHRDGEASRNARAAAVALGRAHGLQQGEVAKALQLGRRTVQRLWATQADPTLQRAILLQMGLRQHLGADRGPIFADPAPLLVGCPAPEYRPARRAA